MASATAPRIPLCAHSGFPILSIFDASTHDYTHARLVSSPCYPRPYLHDLFMPAPYFPPLCLISSTRSCAVLSFCVSLTQAAQAFSIIIDTPPEPLRCARCSSLYLYLYPSLSTLCSCPASRRFRDGPAHSGCTRIPPSSLSSSVRLKNVCLFVTFARRLLYPRSRPFVFLSLRFALSLPPQDMYQWYISCMHAFWTNPCFLLIRDGDFNMCEVAR